MAIPVDQENIKPRNLEDIKPGGLGIYFINKLWMKLNGN